MDELNRPLDELIGDGPRFPVAAEAVAAMRGLLEEDQAMVEIAAPTSIVQGTEDAFISVQSARRADKQPTCRHKLIELDGAQHGFGSEDLAG